MYIKKCFFMWKVRDFKSFTRISEDFMESWKNTPASMVNTTLNSSDISIKWKYFIEVID